MTIDDPVSIARRWHAEVYLQGRDDVAEEICDPDLVAHGTLIPADAPRGPRFVQEDAAAMRKAFRFDSLVDEDVVAADDKVVIRWSFRGTHVGTLMGEAPSGRRVQLEGVDIFRVRNGRISEFWGVYDALSLTQQIGAAPAAMEV